MLKTAASFTMSLDAVGDSLVDSSAAGPATLCAESSCGCKMPTARYMTISLLHPTSENSVQANFRELDTGDVRRISLPKPSEKPYERAKRLTIKRVIAT